MLVYGYKVQASQAQYATVDEATRAVQSVRNTCVRLRMETRGTNQNALQRDNRSVDYKQTGLPDESARFFLGVC